MSHTPGPWRVGEPFAPCLAGELPTVRLSGGGHIAYVYTENPADARLIAAAPDLYAACKTFQRIWDGEISFGQRDLADAENALTAAIAKAEGK